MIIVGTTFFNELELLPLKLEELWDVVDVFILCEADVTFSGMPKERHYWNNRNWFAKYQSKIHYISPQMPTGRDPWIRERFQRDVLASAALDLSSDAGDIFINSDMDEIVSAASVKRWLNGETKWKPTSLNMKLYYYWLNNLATNYPWAGGKIMTVEDIPVESTLSDLRYDVSLPVMEDGGWHFSFLGGVQRIKQKVASYAHNDLYGYVVDTPDLQATVEAGRDWFTARNLTFQFVEIDETYPKHIIENLSAWKDFIK